METARLHIDREGRRARITCNVFSPHQPLMEAFREIKLARRLCDDDIQLHHEAAIRVGEWAQRIADEAALCPSFDVWIVTLYRRFFNETSSISIHHARSWLSLFALQMKTYKKNSPDQTHLVRFLDALLSTANDMPDRAIATITQFP